MNPGMKNKKVYLTVLVCSGCHNKMPKTRWLKEWKFIFSRFWRLTVWHEYACVEWWKFSWLAVDQSQKKQTLHLVTLHIKSLIPTHHEGPTLMTSSNLNYFPKASSPNTITLALRNSIYKFQGEHKHSVHNTQGEHLNSNKRKHIIPSYYFKEK